MKVNRQKDISEKSKITVSWLYEFAYDLEKNAQTIDYLKEYLNKNKKKNFESIEEKLADIRSRVGLDLASKVANEMDHIIQAKENCECHSNTSHCACPINKTAKQHSPNDVERVKVILKYIEDMIQHEPHIDTAIVLSRCQQEDGLRFNDISKKIDRSKLINYINDLLSEKNQEEVSITYQPSKPMTEYDADDRIADYYSHAEPNKR